MRRPLSTVRARRASSRGEGAGFTFMEILVVMALAAVLLGLAVGFLTNAGKTTLTQQAAAILAESGQRCLNQSAGGGRALLELRMAPTPDGDERVEVRTAVQRTVLTANFEPAPADRPGLEWFVYANGPEAATPTGNVKIEPRGHSGGAVAFQGAGVVDFGTRAVFAMTDGLEMEAWVRPSAAGRGVMTILRSDHEGQVLWAVQLLRESGQAEGWKVVLRASLVPADAGMGVMSAGLTEFKSKDAAVLPETWSHLRIGFDGLEPSLQVNGVERWARPVTPRGKEAATPRPMRLSAGASGTAHLLLSAPDAPFTGLVDTLNVAGIFRTDEDSRTLPVGVTLLRTPLPLEVSFLNGRLDPTVHGKDVEVRLQGPGDEASGGWVVIRFGLYGNIPPPYRVEPSLGGGS